MTDERRQADRREEDRLVTFRLDTLESDVVRIDHTLEMMGASTAHLALLDARVDENRRRVTEAERVLQDVEHTLSNIRVGLENVRTKVVLFSAVGSVLGSGLIALAVSFAH